MWALNKTVLTARPSVAANVYSKDELESLVTMTLRLAGSLQEDFLPKNRHKLEAYGSIHLPSFRGPALADRIDY
ncbi:hypothetical protein [Chromobacterium violaceum]